MDWVSEFGVLGRCSTDLNMAFSSMSVIVASVPVLGGGIVYPSILGMRSTTVICWVYPLANV